MTAKKPANKSQQENPAQAPVADLPTPAARMEALRAARADALRRAGEAATEAEQLRAKIDAERDAADRDDLADPCSPSGRVDSELVGYVRRSRAGGALKINICAQAFEKARRYVSQDGQEYVGLMVSLDKVRSVIDGEREVTSVCQLVEQDV